MNPLNTINWYDWKRLGAELKATSLSIGPSNRDASKKASEKNHKTIKKKVPRSVTKLV